MKKIVSILIASLLILMTLVPMVSAEESNTLPMLHTEGDKIFTENGDAIVLRGTNFGGWGIMEDWFCPYTDPSGEENIYLTLVSRFGVEQTHELFKTYRKNWISEQDYKNVADMGMNVIRLPLWFRNFMSDDNGTWYRKDNGDIDFDELDEVVDMCRKYGLYLILDMHGLPGYQNDYDHCGRSKSMSLFDETENGEKNRAITLELWTEIAKHYAGEPVIAMYDLMNEPLGTNITVKSSQRQMFWDFSDELYREIREIDPDHIISMEAIWDPSAIASPSVYGWTNIVYQEHLYDVSNIAMLSKADEIKRAKYNAPFLIGEFYPRGIASFDFMLSLFNKRNLSWTTWTYKGAGSWAEGSPWFLYGSSSVEKIDAQNDSYDTLMQKFGECLLTDSGNFSRTAFADYVCNYVDGTVDKVSLYSLGTASSVGTREQRTALFKDKIKAIYTTILDWLRKLKTGDLL